jgi:hypothetical protein
MMKSTVSASSEPRSVAVGDLNNDYQIDIVVANSGTNCIGVFLSKGNGTFADQQTYPTDLQSIPRSIVVGDFNNDNNLDIAVANYGTHSIGIFLGNGSGIFNDQEVVSLGSSRPLFIAIGDFNNDKRLDLVVANYGTNNIGVLFGYGDGSFQDQVTYFTGYDSFPYSLAVGDFNNDNQSDIAIANSGTNNVGILLGYRDGTFRSQQTYTTLPKSNPCSIAVGDFNSDHKLDIVVANNGTGSVGMFLGHGNGTFLAQRTFSIGSNCYPQYITIGNLNTDNELDVLVVDSENNRVYILSDYGNETFGEISAYDTVTESSPSWVAAADFNNDNQSDIVVANYGTNNVLVLIGYFTKPSAQQVNYDVGLPNKIGLVAVGDFNRDNILDIVFNTNGYIRILTGIGDGTFNRDPTYSSDFEFASQCICIKDVNNDNKIDIVSAYPDFNGVGVFLGYGNGSFASMMNFSTGVGSSPWWIALGDVNNDNLVDIVSANTGSDSVGIHLGHGDGTFSTLVNYFVGSRSTPYSVALGDFNNDNNSDFVVANGNGGVLVFFGNGNGTFTFIYGAFTGGIPFSIALADFNNDNNLDFAIANLAANRVDIFFGYGNGKFAPQFNSLGFNSIPYYIIAADFNHDHICDIAITSYGNEQVIILYRYSNRSVTFGRVYPTGFGSKPYGLTAADLDNDNQLNIVVALQGIGNIAVLTGYYAVEFVNETIYSTGAALESYSVAVGDFNNDNRPDIVVANSGTDSLSILFGFGNGTFGKGTIYPIGTDYYPQYVITCDIDKDNQTDIVSVNSRNDSISIILGNGNGTFKEQMIYSTGSDSNPYAIASGDLNNDTRLDFVVANEGSDTVGIFYGYDYTTFHSGQTYSNNSTLGLSGIVLNDFNNDSFVDIAVIFFTSSKMCIYLGYGNGSFASMMIYSTGNDSQPRGISVGDFNNDGRLDIVVANYGTNNVGIFLGNGNGSFAAIMTFPVGNYANPRAVAVGDFNNDSRLDIVVANYGSNSAGILLGYGDGTFSIVNLYPTGDDSGPYGITTGDFNKDTRLDIAVVLYYTGTVTVFIGNGDGTFGNNITLPIGPTLDPCWVSAGDFNNDNRLDIATSNCNDDSVGILLGYGNGTFSTTKTYSTGNGSVPYYISIGDFNNDKRLDIAVANFGTNGIVVLFGYGDGTFLSGTEYTTGIGAAPNALAVGYFNNDTRLDIAVTNFQSNSVGILLGYESQPYASVITHSTGYGSQPHSVDIADVNNDGRLDIVVANYGTDNVGILLGYSNRSFGIIRTYLTGNGSAPYSVAVADFNDDSYIDIVVTNSETNNIGIFLGYGNGTFAHGSQYSTGTLSSPYIVTTGDFNSDNISDIVIADAGTNNIFLLYGYGNGTFGNTAAYALGYGYHPYSVAVKDLTHDNRTDIIIVCHDTDHVETLIRVC